MQETDTARQAMWWNVERKEMDIQSFRSSGLPGSTNSHSNQARDGSHNRQDVKRRGAKVECTRSF